MAYLLFWAESANQFGRGDAPVFSTDDLAFFAGGGNQGAAGQVVGSTPRHKDQLLILDPRDIVFSPASSSTSLLIARMAANIKPKKAPMKSPIANAIINSSFLVWYPGLRHQHVGKSRFIIPSRRLKVSL